MYGTRCTQLPVHWKTHSMADRAIPLSVCHHGPPNGYRTGFKRCSDAQLFIQLTVVDDINAKAVEAWKQKRFIVNDMYTLILLIQYGIYFWHELAHTPSHFFKLKSTICGNPLAFPLTFDLQYFWTVLRHTSVLIKYKWNKIKLEHGSHICIHTTYNLIMFTYNICKPDDKCRVNTDLPPLKSGEHKINNIEWVTTPNIWMNNLHAIYMILCEMREWFDG